MDNQEEELQEEKRYTGRPTKPDEELAWRRKSAPPASHLLDTQKKKIPKRFQAIFCLMQDDRSATGRVLSREQLDEMPATKMLPKQEKDLLFKYWPSWTTTVAEMQAIAVLRKEQVDIASKSQKIADILEREEELDHLSLQERMRFTAEVFDKQIARAALIVAATSVEDLEDGETRKFSVDLFKQRVGFIKDSAYVRGVMLDAAKRLEEKAQDDFLSSDDHSELTSILIRADEIIQRKAPL